MNTKYISSSELKTSKFSRVRSTSENLDDLDVFKSRDEIYLKVNFLFILYNTRAFSYSHYPFLIYINFTAKYKINQLTVSL